MVIHEIVFISWKSFLRFVKINFDDIIKSDKDCAGFVI